VTASPRLKILQLASFYTPTIGGMETVLQDLSEGLVASGDEVTVLCSSPNVHRADEIVRGVRVRRLSSLGKLLSQPMTPMLPLALRRLHHSFDVVHLHMPNPLAEASILALPRERPFVVTYHADIIRQRVLKTFYGPVQQAVLARSRRIVVPTENHIRYSEVLPEFASKCAVVPFGISRDRYRLEESARDLSRQLRQRHGRFVLFVGRLVYYKGVVDLIESMLNVDAKLVVVGDGPLRAQIAAKVHALHLEARVSLLGALEQPELNAYFDACEVLALPSISRSEGFGMTLLEGMLFGKPLVTTQLPSGVQIVNEDGHTGIQVQPRDPIALGAALRRLLSDDALRTTMGTAGRARLDERFSVDEMIRGYRDVYAKAISDGV
jgi:glycosyltransferase involved in cell wall biosynthesis